MQSLGPDRGHARGRRSQEALLARGIAAPRDASRRLPALSGTRALIGLKPRSLRFGRTGRDPVRGKWLLLSALFLASAVVYGAIIGGQTGVAFNYAVAGVEHVAVAVGFGVQRAFFPAATPPPRAQITAHPVERGSSITAPRGVLARAIDVEGCC